MDIPSGIFTLFNDGVTAMLNSDMAPSCVLVYPPLRTECINCIVNPLTMSSSGRYKTGGPKSFTTGQICPYCQGKGYTETETTITFKVLIDWEPKQYLSIMNGTDQFSHKTQSTIQFPGSLIKIQGDMSYMNQLRQCSEIRIHGGIVNHGYWRYERAGEPIPYGLAHNTYFTCLLTRVG